MWYVHNIFNEAKESVGRDLRFGACIGSCGRRLSRVGKCRRRNRRSHSDYPSRKIRVFRRGKSRKRFYGKLRPFPASGWRERDRKGNSQGWGGFVWRVGRLDCHKRYFRRCNFLYALFWITANRSSGQLGFSHRIRLEWLESYKMGDVPIFRKQRPFKILLCKRFN